MQARLLASIKPEDVDETFRQTDYSTYTPRRAGRAIVFDGQKVALLSVGGQNYYMLPGGGIDKGEGTEEGLRRELLEELGYLVELGAPIGVTEMYIDRWRNKQLDTCFFAEVSGDQGEISRTAFEKLEGHQIVWAQSLSLALQLVETAVPKNRDGKLIQVRDSVFLREALKHFRGTVT